MRALRLTPIGTAPISCLHQKAVLRSHMSAVAMLSGPIVAPCSTRRPHFQPMGRALRIAVSPLPIAVVTRCGVTTYRRMAHVLLRITICRMTITSTGSRNGPAGPDRRPPSPVCRCCYGCSGAAARRAEGVHRVMSAVRPKPAHSETRVAIAQGHAAVDALLRGV